MSPTQYSQYAPFAVPNIIDCDTIISIFSKRYDFISNLHMFISYFLKNSKYKEHKLTHIVCLDALAMAGSWLLNDYKKNENSHVDYQGFRKAIKRLRKIDWSIEGPFKYLKGINGSKTLSKDLYEIMISN
ncbi:MAG: hypothetical protein ACQEXX_24400 [Bacillota bacterium]